MPLLVFAIKTIERFFVLTLGLLFASGCSANQMNSSSTDVQLQCEVNAEALAIGSVILDCTATNLRSVTVAVLRWNTPLDSSLKGRFLQVEDSSGTELKYQGIMVKRGEPSEEDYLNLGPGEQFTNSLDLTISYSFCTNSSYRISYSKPSWSPEHQEIALAMPTVEFSTSEKFESCE